MLIHQVDSAPPGDDKMREIALSTPSSQNIGLPNGKSDDVEAGSKEVTGPTSVQCKKRRLYKRIAVGVTMFGLALVCAALMGYFLGWMSLVQLVLVATVVYIASSRSRYRWFYVFWKTLPRDLRAFKRYLCTQWELRKFHQNNMTVADIFQTVAAKNPDGISIICEDSKWTFQQVEEYSNRVANVFKSHGYQKGDVVAVFMENRPEFVCIWLGLSKLGVIVPLINYNLRQGSLQHSITVAKSQALIFGTELTDAIEEIQASLSPDLTLYKWDTEVSNNAAPARLGEKDLAALLAKAPTTPPTLTERPGVSDHLVYIYTSGTTGLPKAAVITNSKFMFIAGAIRHMSGFRNDDIFYCSLPLYHTAGGIMSMGQMVMFGCTVVIKKKFSASAFFPDCRKYKCTVAQYIGEMCRYILSTPPKPEDKDHNLRLIFGNGLRPQIWKEFVDRFGIPQVAEFYGATEGNANIVNVDGTVGAIGFVSRILPSVYPISIIKVDPATGEPIRNSKGLCIPCKPDEPGVFIGKITTNPGREFLGYIDKRETSRKVVHDVFSKGEMAFHSGDLLIADEFGYLYFIDRTGDTFRWKGENVSTSEVEAVVSNVSGYRDAVVFGVEIAGNEGRAGMAAIVDKDSTLDLKLLAEGIRKALPSYARPQFVRLLREVEMTGTYKLKKNDLQKEGYNPAVIKDRIYFLTSKGDYQLLTEELYKQITTGQLRV